MVIASNPQRPTDSRILAMEKAITYASMKGTVTAKDRDYVFASSLCDQWNKRGSLSEKQWHWVEKLTNRFQQGPASQPKHAEQVGNMTRLIDMMEKARGHLKYPKLYLETEPVGVLYTCENQHCRNGTGRSFEIMTRVPLDEAKAILQARPDIPCPQCAKTHPEWKSIMVGRLSGYPVRLSLAGPRAHYHGEIMVTDGGPYGDNVWYGRVTKDGEWIRPHQDLPEKDMVQDLLQRMAAEPEKTAASHGHLHGACCFCNKELTDARSLEAGYGPTCAKNFGLDWGKEKT